MANYKPTVLTKKGEAILQKVIQGQLTLNFTKLEIGVGQVPEGTSLKSLESLIDSKISVEITNIKNNEDGSCSVCGSYTNDGITESYILNEIGLFAKDENNEDVLYAYSTADGEGDWFGASATLLQENIEVMVYVSTATDITANISHTVKASDVDMDGVDLKTIIVGMQTTMSMLETGLTGIADMIEDVDTNVSSVTTNITSLMTKINAINTNVTAMLNKSAIKKVQRGVISIAQTDSKTQYVSISSVDMNKSFVTVSSSVTDHYDGLGIGGYARLASSSQLTIAVGSVYRTVYVSYEVVEFN